MDRNEDEEQFQEDGQNTGPLDWYMAVPIVTRIYMTGIAIVSLACHLNYVGPLQLYFNYRLTFQRHQWWRLVTPFLYFGPISFDFIFHMFFLLRYCRLLEEDSVFRHRPADFIVMIFFGALMMLAISPIFKAAFLSTSLTFMIVYVWSRRNPLVLMNFLGAFNFYAPAMPWVLLTVSFFVSGRIPTADFIGIVVGHSYYYLSDVYPRVAHRSSPLAAPQWLKDLVNPPEIADINILQLMQQQQQQQPVVDRWRLMEQQAAMVPLPPDNYQEGQLETDHLLNDLSSDEEFSGVMNDDDARPRRRLVES